MEDDLNGSKANIKSWISQSPLLGSYPNLKLNFLQTLQMKTSSDWILGNFESISATTVQILPEFNIMLWFGRRTIFGGPTISGGQTNLGVTICWWHCRHMRRNCFAHIAGGPTGGSIVRRPRSEDPHRPEWKFNIPMEGGLSFVLAFKQNQQLEKMY